MTVSHKKGWNTDRSYNRVAPQNIMSNERSQAQNTTYIWLNFIWNIQNLMDAWRRMAVWLFLEGCGEEKMGRNCLMDQVLLWSDEMFWSQMHVVVTTHCKCTKHHWIFHVKIVNFILCKFHFNTLSFKNIWRLLEEMDDLEAGVGNIQDESGLSYSSESTIFL